MLSHYLTISVIRLVDFHIISIQAGHPINRDIYLGILQKKIDMTAANTSKFNWKNHLWK